MTSFSFQSKIVHRLISGRLRFSDDRRRRGARGEEKHQNMLEVNCKKVCICEDPEEDHLDIPRNLRGGAGPGRASGTGRATYRQQQNSTTLLTLMQFGESHAFYYMVQG
ncbi:hypothetical protein PUN28_011289 [Cardiocondyla obscurior]|uniref:Uncharacterized protein n=1 Tax=Cardiocondyla obscurior TaxID=286306 RepID=A0AAW2FGW0_9HYME